MKQFHFRTEDEELILSIEHEQRRAGLSGSAAVQALVRSGIEHSRWLREQEALSKHKGVEHDQQAAGA